MRERTEPGSSEPSASLLGLPLVMVVASAIAAAAAQGLLWDPDSTPPLSLDVIVAAGILVLGGGLAGWSLGRTRTVRHVVGALLVPLAVVVPAFVLMAGLSGSAGDMPVAIAISGAIYALLAVPMLSVYLSRSGPPRKVAGDQPRASNQTRDDPTR